MRPMFGGYGSKWRISKYYGSPRQDLVIEPFAGSACYSLYWNAPNVKLYDLSDDICMVWDYLINCSTADINNLPTVIRDIDHLHSLPLTESRLIARWIWFNNSEVTPPFSELRRYKKWIKAGSDKIRLMWGQTVKNRIIRQKDMIKNWTITQMNYTDVDNDKAHWHIDPPYDSEAGRVYKHGSQYIDFRHLAEWCKSRNGDVDVCEMEGANWLPFCNFRRSRGIANRFYNEVVWRKRTGGLFND